MRKYINVTHTCVHAHTERLRESVGDNAGLDSQLWAAGFHFLFLTS